MEGMRGISPSSSGCSRVWGCRVRDEVWVYCPWKPLVGVSLRMEGARCNEVSEMAMDVFGKKPFPL